MRTIGQARELLPPGSDRTPEWYEARRPGITASEIAAVMGLSKWQSPLSLYFSKLDGLEGEPDNDKFRLGRVLEPYVLERFQEMTGVETAPCGLVCARDRPWQLATPDAVQGGIPVEAKTAVSEEDWGPSGSDEVPLYYRCQLVWQADVLGAPFGYMCVLFLRSGEPRWYRIERDAEDVLVMREAALDFLRRLDEGDPPQPDGLDATTTALRRRYEPDEQAPDAVCGKGLRRSYVAALRAYGAADERKKLMSNRVRMAMGPSVRLRDPDGDIVATRRGPKNALYPGRGLN